MPQDGQLITSTQLGDTLIGGPGNDTLIGSHGGHLVDITAGGDNLVTVTLPDTTSGNNLVLGGPGTDRLTLLRGDGHATRVLHGRYTDSEGAQIIVTATSDFDAIEAFATRPGDASLSFGRTTGSTFSTTSWRDIERVDIEGGSGSDLLLPQGDGARAIGGSTNNTLYADWRGQETGVTWHLADTLTEPATLANGWEVQGIQRLLLRLSDGGNAITTSGQDNTIFGGAGDDTLIGTAGGDHFDLTAGGDNHVTVTLVDVAGRDSLVLGGPGVDHLTLRNSDAGTGYVLHGRTTDAEGAPLIVTAASDFATIEAFATQPGDPTLSYGGISGTVVNRFSTASWRDIERVDIEGGRGSDLLIPQGEVARAIGGSATNTLYADWRGQDAGVTWHLADTLTDPATLANGWEVQGIQRLLLRLSDGGNVLTTHGLDNVIFGGAGDDTLIGTAGGDHFDLTAGGDNHVTVIASSQSGRDTEVIGGAGTDRLTLRAPEGLTARFYLRSTDDEGTLRGVFSDAAFEDIEAAVQREGPGVLTFGSRWQGTLHGSTVTHSDIATVDVEGANGSDLLVPHGVAPRALGGGGTANTLYADWRGQAEGVTWDMAASLEAPVTLANGWTVHNIHRALLRLGAGDNDITLQGRDNVIFGGTGNDRIVVPIGDDRIDLGAGGDNHVIVYTPDDSSLPGILTTTLTGGDGFDTLTLIAPGSRQDRSRFRLQLEREDGSIATLTEVSSFADIDAAMQADGPLTQFYFTSVIPGVPGTSRATTITHEGFDRLEMIGSTGDDLLVVRGPDGRALGGGGTNTLWADWSGPGTGLTWDMAATLDTPATLGNGWEVQGIHRALLRLPDGDNLITTAGRHNHIIAGTGNDTLIGGHSGDHFDLSAGGDNHVTITAGTWSDRDNMVIGGAGADHLTLRAERPDLTGVFHIRLTEPIDGAFRVTADSSPELIAAAAPLVGSLGVTFSSLTSTNTSASRWQDIDSMTWIGAAGNDLMIGTAGNDLFRGGMGRDVVFGNGGHNTIVGTLAELHLDSVLDFTPLDTLLVEGAELAPEAVVFNPAQSRLEIARPEGGTTHILLPGEFHPAGFTVTAADGATRITYTGAPPLALPTLQFEAVQDGPAVTADLLALIGLAGVQISAINGQPLGAGLSLTGALGLLQIDADGRLSYAPERATHLPEGVTGTDAFTVTATDAFGTAATGPLTFAVTGINDPASIAGDTTATLVEGDPVTIATGQLTVTDPDIGEARLQAPDPAALIGAHGVFALDPLTGDWSYALNNCAPSVRALGLGETASDSLTVTSLDGTATATLTVTVEGSGIRELTDPAVLAGTVSDRADAPVAGATVSFTPADGPPCLTLSDAAGGFGFTLPEGVAGHLDATRPHMPGDPGVSIAGAINALRMALGLAPSWGPARPMDYIAADFDGNGTVAIADAIAMLRVALGLPEAHQPRWIFLPEGMDLGGIDRSNTHVDTGLSFEALAADMPDIALTGILIGDVQGYA